jgi:hypothetical protein
MAAVHIFEFVGANLTYLEFVLEKYCIEMDYKRVILKLKFLTNGNICENMILKLYPERSVNIYYFSSVFIRKCRAMDVPHALTFQSEYSFQILFLKS